MPRQIATACGGDVRKAINAVELLCSGSACPERGSCMLTLDDVGAGGPAQRHALRPGGGDDHVRRRLRPDEVPRGAATRTRRSTTWPAFWRRGTCITPCRRLLVLRQRGCGDGLSPGGLHCEGMCGYCHAAGAAGGPAAPGPGGYPAGHGPQVQQRDSWYRRRPGQT